MIVSGGENVFPAEVEELLHGHPEVADVAVFGVEDEKFGQRLKAVIVRKGPPTSLSEKDVQDYVKKNLAGYKAPRDVVFMDELPRTSTGKVLKRELKEA
jgi:acyl-CoA synthetase (AMP-forming)/AMP-acid ligase II